MAAWEVEDDVTYFTYYRFSTEGYKYLNQGAIIKIPFVRCHCLWCSAAQLAIINCRRRKLPLDCLSLLFKFRWANAPLAPHSLPPFNEASSTVESLSAEASGNLSTNRNHLISTIVKWNQFGCSTAFVWYVQIMLNYFYYCRIYQN